MIRTYKLSDGTKVVFEYDCNGIGKITLEDMDILMSLLKATVDEDELNRDDETCKRIHDICKKCEESAARYFDGERYIVCTKVGIPPKHIICFELSECPLKKWGFEDKPPCETCINYGVEFTDDDSFDTCLVNECHYEPKSEELYDHIVEDISTRVKCAFAKKVEDES